MVISAQQSPSSAIREATCQRIRDLLKAQGINLPAFNVNKVEPYQPDDHRYRVVRGTNITSTIANKIKWHIPDLIVCECNANLVIVQPNENLIADIQSQINGEPMSDKPLTDATRVTTPAPESKRFYVGQPVWYDANLWEQRTKFAARLVTIRKIGAIKICIAVHSTKLPNHANYKWVDPGKLTPDLGDETYFALEADGTSPYMIENRSRLLQDFPGRDWLEWQWAARAKYEASLQTNFDEYKPDPDWRTFDTVDYQAEAAYYDAVATAQIDSPLPVLMGEGLGVRVNFHLRQSVVATRDIDTPEGIKNIYHGDDGFITNLDPLTVKFTVLNHGDWQQIEVTVNPDDIRLYGKQLTFPGLDNDAITAAKMVNNYQYLTGVIESLQKDPDAALVDQLNRTRLDLQRAQIALEDARKKSAITPLNEFTLLRQENADLRTQLAEREAAPLLAKRGGAGGGDDEPKQYDVRIVPQIDERTLQGFINMGWEIISTGWTPVITDSGYTHKPAFNVTVRREQCPPPEVLHTFEEIDSELFAAVDTTAQLQHIIAQEPALQEMFATTVTPPLYSGEAGRGSNGQGGEVESSPLHTAYKHGQQKPDPNDPAHIEAEYRAREKLFGKRRAGEMTFNGTARAHRAAATLDERATDELPVVPPPCEAGRGLGGGDISIVDTTPPSLTDLVSQLPIAATIAQVGAENTAQHLINSALQAGFQAAQQHAQLHPLRPLTQLKETN